MVHDHNHSKTVGIREFQQNIYQNLPAPGESTLITNRGQAMYCVSSLGPVATTASAFTASVGINKGENNENNS